MRTQETTRAHLSLGLRLLAVAAAYFALGILTLYPPVHAPFWHVVWPATGVALAVLLRGGVVLWPGIAVGAFTATLVADGSVGFAAATALANTLEIVIAVQLLRRVAFRASLEQVSDVVQLVVLAGGVATALGALISVAGLCLTGGAPWPAFLDIWLRWWRGHALGMLVVAPPLFVLSNGARAQLRQRAWEAVTLFTTLVLVGHLVFGRPWHSIDGIHSGSYPVAFIPFPLLIWAALRFGPPGAAIANLVISGLAMLGSARGVGPFVAESMDESLLLTWIFVNVSAVTTLLLAAVVATRNRTQAALRRSEGLNRGIVEAIPGGIIQVGNDGRIYYANDEAARILGSSPDLLVGSPARAIEAHALGEAGHEWPPDEHPISRCLESGAAQGPVTIGMRRPDGQIIWAVSTAVPVRNGDAGKIEGAIITFMDITDRRRMEERLAKSEARWRSLAENVPAIITTVARDGQILSINRTVTDTPIEDVIGQSIFDHIPPDQHDTVRYAMDRVCETGKPEAFEVEAPGPSGTKAWYHTRVGAVPQVGQVDTLTFISTDITEDKRARHALQHTQKLESLGVLAGGIAHDFNNLLVGILGNADLAALDLGDGDPSRRRVGEIRRAALRASELTNQLLTYAGKATFTTALLQMNDLVQEMGHLLKTVISKKAIVEYSFDRDLPMIRGDSSQIRQVAMNLITNASEALGSNGGTITVRTRTVDVDARFFTSGFPVVARPGGRYASLEVSDTGAGMDPETAMRIFDPFFTTKFAGRGLGLAAVLGIMNSHAGAIKVESHAGRGTTFRVLFPVSSARSRVEPRASRPHQIQSWEGGGTILVVDDEETVRCVVKPMLERHGFSVLTANNGREGVEVLQAHRDAIRAVLLDMTMPEMSGDEAFREMHLLCPNTPVLLLSGYAEDEALSRFPSEGLAGFLQKPFRRETLLAKIRDVLESTAV